MKDLPDGPISLWKDNVLRIPPDILRETTDSFFFIGFMDR